MLPCIETAIQHEDPCCWYLLSQPISRRSTSIDYQQPLHHAVQPGPLLHQSVKYLATSAEVIMASAPAVKPQCIPFGSINIASADRWAQSTGQSQPVDLSCASISTSYAHRLVERCCGDNSRTIYTCVLSTLMKIVYDKTATTTVWFQIR